MNNPFYTYPNHPFHGGYDKFDVYINEVIRLKNIIDELKIYNRKQIIFMAVGAAMEEITYDVNYSRYKQWKQLFPSYIENIIINRKDTKVTIIIISPNVSFLPDKYVDPVFIKMTHKIFKWENKYRKNVYTSPIYNITVHVICSKFPSKNVLRSKYIFNKLCELSKKSNVCINTNNIIQTENDLKFINNFYKSLDELINNINGIIICNSYATFNNMSMYGSTYNNYRMFSELKDIFLRNSDKKNIILSEWIHDIKNTNTKTIKGENIDYTKGLFEQLNISTCHFS